VLVALAVLLAVPVAQLRFIHIEGPCCCPQVKRCNCPDHDPGTSRQSSIRPCHRTPRVIATPSVPGFVPAAGSALPAPERAVAVASFAPEALHAPPALAPAEAPS
jgi:hypothetical protein